MNRVLLLPVLALPLLAAAPPQRGLTLQVPQNNSPLLPVPPVSPLNPARTGPDFAPAPTPNRNIDSPLGPRASTAPSLSPSLFTRSDQFRGDGYTRDSSSQTEVERRMKPGAGFNLRMPLTGQ